MHNFKKINTNPVNTLGVEPKTIELKVQCSTIELRVSNYLPLNSVEIITESSIIFKNLIRLFYTFFIF